MQLEKYDHKDSMEKFIFLLSKRMLSNQIYNLHAALSSKI